MTLGSMLVLHRMLGTWQQRVTKFIALNDFCRRKFIEGGLPGERIVIKPNFVDFGAPAERQRSGFLFVGRLSMEKGIEVLRNAAMLLSPAELVVVGSGPAEFLLTGIPGVELLGARTKKEVGAQMSKTLALIFPSVCFETFGLVIIEAFAHGTPVIASHIGVVTDLVEDGVTGLLFAPGNDAELAEKITWARSHPEEMAIMGRRARLKFEEYFTPDKNYDQLLAIYEEARLC